MVGKNKSKDSNSSTSDCGTVSVTANSVTTTSFGNVLRRTSVTRTEEFVSRQISSTLTSEHTTNFTGQRQPSFTTDFRTFSQNTFPNNPLPLRSNALSSSSTRPSPIFANLQRPLPLAIDATPFTSNRSGNASGAFPRIHIPAPSTSTKLDIPRTPVSAVPEYNTNGLRRGNVLIINNIDFPDKMERKGAVFDQKALNELFKNFGFNVCEYTNLTGQGIQKRIVNFRSDRSLSRYDMCIVIIMSHGTNNNRIGGYTEIIGTDGKGVSTDDVINEFTIEKCPAMRGKPKIFIFQCCRGTNQEVHVDSKPTSYKNCADMLVCYSTLPGFFSCRDPSSGSWYIQSICQVFQQHAKNEHLEDMFKMVDVELTNKHPVYKQTSIYENRGFKKCYLNPK